MAITLLTTVEDLALMPEDGNRYLLIQGELIRLSPTNFRHAETVSQVTWHFMNFAHDFGGSVLSGDGGFILHNNPDTVLAPDVAYIQPERVPPDSAKDGYSHVVPDVVVEIISPSERPGLQRRKRSEYLAGGVRLIVNIDLRTRIVTVHPQDGIRLELGEDDTFDAGDVMPGFRLPVKKFFER